MYIVFRFVIFYFDLDEIKLLSLKSHFLFEVAKKVSNSTGLAYAERLGFLRLKIRCLLFTDMCCRLTVTFDSVEGWSK